MHALDRLIRGIGLLAKQSTHPLPELIAVGSGFEYDGLRRLVEELGLADCVSLRGPAHGRDLDELYDWADIGVGSLGIHRDGLDSASPIKHREYLAKGLPVLLTELDPWIASQSAQFHGIAFVVPDDESEIDLPCLMAWAAGHFNPLAARSFAERVLDFRVTHVPAIVPTALHSTDGNRATGE